MSLRDAAWSALGQVRDPELDRPITDLGFVFDLRVDGDTIRAELRLPTYFCAPNFAWLMVADARDALAPLALHTEVVLVEHFVSDEINAGVAAVNQFESAFDSDGDLEELRTTFERKAHMAAQERLARALGPGDLVRVTVAEAMERVPDETAGVLRRRDRLGIRSEYALCDDEGAPLSEDKLPGWLRFARTVRVSIEGNAGFCRGLLETRYGLEKMAGAGGGLQ